MEENSINCGIENGRWWTEVSETVSIETRDRQRYLVYSGERKPKKIDEGALWDVLKRLKKADFSDESIISVQQEFGPFAGSVFEEQGGKRLLEPIRPVWVGYHALQAGLWMLETLKMTDRQFRNRVKIGDLLSDSEIAARPEERRIGIYGPDGGAIIVSSNAGDDLKSMKDDVRRVLSREITLALQNQHLLSVHPEKFEFGFLPCGLQAFFWEQIRMIANQRNNVKLCPVCNNYFFPKKTSGVKTCGNACRQAKRRGQKR